MLSKLLSEQPIQVSRSLAKELGLKESIIYSFVVSNDRLTLLQDITSELRFMDKKTIERKLDFLIAAKHLNKITLSPEEKKTYLQQYKTSNKDIGRAECEWCKSTTLTLHEHHYPIPKNEGGKEVVRICPNCHYEFHSMNFAYTLGVRGAELNE